MSSVLQPHARFKTTKEHGGRGKEIGDRDVSQTRVEGFAFGE